MLAVLGMLVISIQHLVSAVFPGPYVRCALHSPRDWPCHAGQPFSQADNTLVHACWHVIAVAFSI